MVWLLAEVWVVLSRLVGSETGGTPTHGWNFFVFSIRTAQDFAIFIWAKHHLCGPARPACTIIHGHHMVSLRRWAQFWSRHHHFTIGVLDFNLDNTSVAYCHSGTYTWDASEIAGTISCSTELIVNGNITWHFFTLALPSIQPFSFGRPVINQGEVGQLLCTVLTGDEPITMSWSLQGGNISSGPDLTISQLGSRTSILMISSITYHHSGIYTCVASNAAGSATFSSELEVNGIKS